MNRRVLAAAWLLPSLALLLPLRLPAATAAASGSSAPATIEQRPEGIIISHGGLLLDLEVRADNVIRVAASPNRAFFSAGSLDVLPQSGVTPKWAFSQTADAATLTTDPNCSVSVDLASGAVSFFDAAGAAILAEVPGSRALDAADVQGEHTAHVQQQWRQQDGESLYGLGQQQLGIVDLKGYDLDFWQRNTNVVVPFLVSSNGYGILWDNLSYSRFGDLRDFTAIPADCLVDATGQPGGLTTGTFTAAAPDQLQNPATTANIVRRGGRGARGRGGAPGRAAHAPAGSARSSPPPPAITNSKPTPTAASRCGWTANSSLTTGAKTGSPKTTR